MKIQCLDELGVGWLVQVLNGEPSKPPATSLSMGTANAAGERVDILNAVDDPHMVDEVSSSSEDEATMNDSMPSLRRHQRPGSRYADSANIRDRLQQIKNDEQDARLNSERDDIRIQEQALDFIRNFITDEKTSSEMIDHLLKSFGHSAFFELLDAKLRPKGSSASSSSPNPSAAAAASNPPGPSYWSPTPRLSSFSSPAAPSLQPNWAAYPPTDLIIAALYILVHLANGRPAHRSLLISQTHIMTHVLPLLSHPRRDVRLPCAWLLCNLVWVEDHHDEQNTRDRALQLRHLGFDDAARLLARDIDLDVRERAKTALEQMTKLLGGATGNTGYASPAAAAGSPFGAAAEAAGVTGLAGMRGGLGSLHPHRGHGGWSNRE